MICKYYAPDKKKAEEIGTGYPMIRTGEYVAQKLAEELIAKKLHACSWIRSIRSAPDYQTGGDIVTVIYDHGGRSVYWTKRDEDPEA